MKTTSIVIIGILSLGLLITGAVALSVISTSNQEVSLRTTIETKQKDNTSQFDNMFKSIDQAAQVTSAQKDALIEIFNGYAQARTGNGGGGEVMKWVQESIPNVDTKTFQNLQNIITSKRDEWTMRQREILDLSREHTTLLRRFPSGMILGFLGRKEIPVQIITSARTKETFVSGEDNNTSLFKK